MSVSSLFYFQENSCGTLRNAKEMPGRCARESIGKRQNERVKNKMKFLLIALNAKYIHSNPAVYCLRSYTAAKDAALADQVVIAEYTINQETDEILQTIYEQKPDVAAFSCYIWNIRRIKELVRELKKVLPGTDIWLGGPEVSFDAGERLKELPEVTGVMRGEGEETVYELVQTYAGKCETGNRRDQRERSQGRT